jgi:hypothetical protein
MDDERLGKIETELIADGADKDAGEEQWILCLPERMGKNATVSLQVDFIRPIVLTGQKVGRGIV